MANLQQMYDPNDKPNEFEVLPAGRYLAAITESAMKPTSKGTGEYLELKFQIIDGPYKGRVLFSRLNLKNPNPQAVQIARGDLAAIRKATGVVNPKDSVELHNLPVTIIVKVGKNKDSGEANNEIKGFLPRNAQPPVAGDAQSTPGAPAAAATPPWQRNA
jgi:hypothetical protein